MGGFRFFFYFWINELSLYRYFGCCYWNSFFGNFFCYFIYFIKYLIGFYNSYLIFRGFFFWIYMCFCGLYSNWFIWKYVYLYFFFMMCILCYCLLICFYLFRCDLSRFKCLKSIFIEINMIIFRRYFFYFFFMLFMEFGFFGVIVDGCFLILFLL